MRRFACGAVAVLGLALLVSGRGRAAEAEWTTPVEQVTNANPVPRESGLAEGKKLFGDNCAPCHGPTGRGDGPVAVALNPRPKNLSAQPVQAQTDGELFWKMSTGRGPMPSWQALSEKDRWSLVHYLRSLAEPKGR